MSEHEIQRLRAAGLSRESAEVIAAATPIPTAEQRRDFKRAELRRAQELSGEFAGMVHPQTLPTAELDPPLNVDTFLAGLDSPNHSQESRRAWVRLFYRDLIAAARQPGPTGLREALDRLPITMGYMDGDDEQRDELTVLVSKEQVLAALAARQPGPRDTDRLPDWMRRNHEAVQVPIRQPEPDGLREALGEWLVERVEVELSPGEQKLYDALRAALAAPPPSPEPLDAAITGACCGHGVECPPDFYEPSDYPRRSPPPNRAPSRP